MKDEPQNTRLDDNSFEALFHRLQPRMYAYCRKYIDDGELARDLVQECFLNLWLNIDNVTVSAESYLFRALHNRCLSHFRSLKVREGYKRSVKSQLNELSLQAPDPYPLEELYLKEADELLAACIEGLPEKCREIFLMSRYRDMSSKDIAAKTGLSQRTVESHIYHALKILRHRLKGYLPLLASAYPWLF